MRAPREIPAPPLSRASLRTDFLACHWMRSISAPTIPAEMSVSSHTHRSGQAQVHTSAKIHFFIRGLKPCRTLRLWEPFQFEHCQRIIALPMLVPMLAIVLVLKLPPLLTSCWEGILGAPVRPSKSLAGKYYVWPACKAPQNEWHCAF